MIRYLLKVLFTGNLGLKFIEVGRRIDKILRYEGFPGLLQRTKMGLADLNQRIGKPFKREPLDLGCGSREKLSGKKVSIVIPTKNAGTEFESLLSTVRKQKGVEQVELLIIDSGSEDQTLGLVEKFEANLYRIDPERFNHGLTRNLGAEKARGEYLVFMVQDAIPLNEYWLYTMIKVLETDPKIGAVACRQFPQKDADLFSRFMNFNHYDSMQLQKDEVRFVANREEYHALSAGDKRRVSQLDNVCTCFRKHTFESYQFRETKYAEDLEIGARMAMDGHKLAFLASNGVIHSHNRSSLHFLKRGYIDRRLTPGFLKYVPASPIIPKGMSIQEVLLDMKSLYSCVWVSLVKLKVCDRWDHMISIFPSSVLKEMKNPYVEKRPVENAFEMFFDGIETIIGKTVLENEKKRPNIFVDGFILNLKRFKTYILEHECLDDRIRDQLDEALFKLLGLWLGQYLGDIVNAKERLGEVWIRHEELDAFLSAGL